MVKTVETVAGIRWLGRQTGPVKSLRGFNKSRHTVPDAVNATTQAFLGKLCADELAKEAEALFARARSAFSYKRKEISLSVQAPTATLAAMDFRHDWSYALTEEDPGRFEAIRALSEVRHGEWLRSPACAEVFSGAFTELVFSLSRGAPVEKVIDAVEGLSNTALSVDYPSDCSSCHLSVPDVDAAVRFDGRELSLVFPRPGHPAELWDAFLLVRSAFRLTDDGVLSGLLTRDA